MSNLIFPEFPGLGWPLDRVDEWSTSTVESVSGRRFSMANWSIPVRKYTLTIEFARSRQGWDEWQRLVAFYQKMQGSFDDFLFFDPEDCVAINQLIGVGDGVTKSFQLVRPVGDWVGPVFGVKTIESLTVDGKAKVYSVSDNGLVTFQTAPTAGAKIIWSGIYYQRVRFSKDEQSTSEFLKGFHSVRKIELETVKP